MTKMRSSYTAAQAAMTKTDKPHDPVLSTRAFLDQRMTQISKWVRGGVKPESLVRFALMDVQGSPALQKADPQSIYLALLACAVVGLEPGSLKGEAYIVPFAGKAQFMLGYRGMIKLAKRSGEVTGMTANIVCERDTFDLDLGTANCLVHRPALTNRGETIGAYAIARMRDGGHEIEWLDMEDLDRIRNVAELRGKSPAWRDWPDQQQRKSAIRRLSKRLPLGHDYLIAQAMDMAVEETGKVNQILDLETDGEATVAEINGSTAKQMAAQAGEVTSDEAAQIEAMERS